MEFDGLGVSAFVLHGGGRQAGGWGVGGGGRHRGGACGGLLPGQGS